jgi:hypothetical protein
MRDDEVCDVERPPAEIMDHDLFIPSRPREQRQMRGRHGRASDKGNLRAQRVKHARRVARADAPASPNHKLIERGLNGDACGGLLAMRVADLARRLDRALHPLLRRTLYALDRVDSPILHKDERLRAVGHAVAMHDRWIRKPDDYWPDPNKKEQGHLNAFLRHLFCAYRVPVPFNWAWGNDDGTVFCAGGRAWFVHVGGGGSLRTAPGLPYALSRAQAHAVMHARDDLTLPQAMRCGQLAGMGVTEPLALAAVMTRLGRSSIDNETALVVARWLVVNPDVRAAHVQQIVDYVIGRRGGNEYLAPQRQFHLGARSTAQVLRDVALWHAELNRLASARATHHLTWASCGIDGFEQLVMNESGAFARWAIVELTTQQALAEEGRAMRHCVASFGSSASRGQCAIFALRCTDATGATRHVATIEVELPARRIAQVAAACNRQPDGAARDLIKRWAESSGVSMSGPSRAH